MNTGMESSGMTANVGKNVVVTVPKIMTFTVSTQRKFLRNFLKVPFVAAFIPTKIFFDCEEQIFGVHCDTRHILADSPHSQRIMTTGISIGTLPAKHSVISSPSAINSAQSTAVVITLKIREYSRF